MSVTAEAVFFVRQHTWLCMDVIENRSLRSPDIKKIQGLAVEGADGGLLGWGEPRQGQVVVFWIDLGKMKGQQLLLFGQRQVK